MDTLLCLGLGNALVATALAGLAAAAGRLCRRPALRHGLWLLVLLKLLTPSFLPAPLPWPPGPQGRPAAGEPPAAPAGGRSAPAPTPDAGETARPAGEGKGLAPAAPAEPPPTPPVPPS